MKIPGRKKPHWWCSHWRLISPKGLCATEEIFRNELHTSLWNGQLVITWWSHLQLSHGQWRSSALQEGRLPRARNKQRTWAWGQATWLELFSGPTVALNHCCRKSPPLKLDSFICRSALCIYWCNHNPANHSSAQCSYWGHSKAKRNASTHMKWA